MADLIVALDLPSREDALAVVERLGDAGTFYKVGLELFVRAGPPIVEELRARKKRVFLDLKLHDIPNTVTAAVRAAAALDVELLTVHAAGGTQMLAVASEAAGPSLKILAVTVLTSLAAHDVGAVWGREILSLPDEVVRLAELAAQTGIHGVVASVLEGARIRSALGADFLIVTPGIRARGADRADQSRVASAAAAVAAGADYLVVGRPVTRAPDARAALLELRAEMAAAVPA